MINDNNLIEKLKFFLIIDGNVRAKYLLFFKATGGEGLEVKKIFFDIF